MRKYFLTISLLCFSISIWGQGHRVDFQLNNLSSFVRTDSDKNYYVFEYDTNINAKELESLYHNELEKIHDLPDYIARFEKNCIRLKYGNYNSSRGTIEGETPAEYFGSEVISIKYSFRLLFKDGRVRIDAPVLIMKNWTYGQYDENVYVSPSGYFIERTPLEWSYKNKEGHSYKEEEIAKRKQYVTELANSLINGLLELIDSRDNAQNWENVHELPQKREMAFKFGNSFCFEFPDSCEYVVYNMNGLSKNQLKNLIYEYYKKDYWAKGLEILNNGVQLASTKSVNIHSIIGNKTLIPHDFHFALYLECENNLVKVYLPKILSVKNYGPSADVNLPSFLIVNKICNKDGTHNQTEKRIEDINTINTEFNNLALGPLYFIKDYQEQVRKEKEDKEKW